VDYSGTTKKGQGLAAKVSRPDWCQITVYRIIGGHRCAFPGPRIYFDEFFSQRRGADVPNERWARAPRQMLEKCAEAAALRRAFPEEFGDEQTAEEMDGKSIIEGSTIPQGPALIEAEPQARPLPPDDRADAEDATISDADPQDDDEGEKLARAEAQGEFDAQAEKPRDPEAHGFKPGSTETLAYCAGWDRIEDDKFPGDRPAKK
jgi:hypothetical protein